MSKDPQRFRFEQLTRLYPGRLQTLHLACHGIALAVEGIPAHIIHQPQAAADFGQTHVSVVFTQHQAIFSPAGEHTIRLGYTARNQVVHQYAQIGFIALRTPRLASRNLQRGINTRQQSLRGGLLIASGAIDLAGKEQALDRFGFQRSTQIARIEVVVLDSIARAQYVRLFQPANGMHQFQLHIERQTGRHPVGIILVGGQAFGLEKNLVRALAGEAMDLVFDRWAVARPDSFNLAGIHRRAIQPSANDVVRTFIGMGDPAR